MLLRVLFIVALSLMLASCTSVTPTFAPHAPCEAEAFTVLDDFAGARRGQCEVLSGNHVRLTISPENDGYINDSPWYAFSVVPNANSSATITLRYSGGHHRYSPKISHDGVHWSALDASDVKISHRRGKATITIATGVEPFWIAGQEITTPLFYGIWNNEIASEGAAELSVLGLSQSEIPVWMLNANPAAADVLLLIGRQHPPEVTGDTISVVLTLTGTGVHSSSPKRCSSRSCWIDSTPAVRTSGFLSTFIRPTEMSFTYKMTKTRQNRSDLHEPGSRTQSSE